MTLIPNKKGCPKPDSLSVTGAKLLYFYRFRLSLIASRISSMETLVFIPFISSRGDFPLFLFSCIEIILNFLPSNSTSIIMILVKGVVALLYSPSPCGCILLCFSHWKSRHIQIIPITMRGVPQTAINTINHIITFIIPYVKQAAQGNTPPIKKAARITDSL